MKIFLMTSPVDFAGEHELIEQLFEKHPFSLHVRKPKHSEQGLEKFLLGLPAEIRELAILHGNPEIADSFSMAGVALPFPHIENIPENFEKKLYGKSHQIKDLENLPKRLSGVILYPVYDSFTEPSVKSQIPSDFSASQIPLDTLACGGVSEDEFKELMNKGYAGAIVCGSVWNYADPVIAWNRITRMAFRLSQ